MTNAARRSLSFFGVCGFLAAALALGNCGGSSGGGRTGGTGGRGGSGGTGGSAGSTGTGGTTSTGLSCTPGVDPAMPLLSDWSATTWSNSAGKWGTVGNLRGSIFGYRGPNTTTAAWPAPTVTNEALTAAGTVTGGDYAGVGMAFDQCVNTTQWTGISFTLGGGPDGGSGTGGCSVQFQVQTFEQQAVSNKGGCDQDAGVSCYQFPKLTLASSAGSFTVRWTALENTGMPATAAAMKAEIIGFQWQMVTNAPADASAQADCTVNMTIDNVAF